MAQNSPLLAVRNLQVSFAMPKGALHAVRGLSYELHRGEILGIAGESGSGKSVGVLALLGLLRRPGKVTGGEAIFDGTDLLRLREGDLCALRGRRIGMMFQNPMSSLNPVCSIGKQLVEAGTCHGSTRQAAHARALELLHLVGMQDPKGAMARYPHELSGGQLQRVMIAMALFGEPDLLIADEPTTALDVTIQAQILELLRRLQRETGMAVLFVTHNLAVLAQLCDRVAVMYAGMLLEEGTVQQVYRVPRSPYTQALLESIPTFDKSRPLPFLPGAGPDPYEMQDGCPFAPRCGACMEVCCRAIPPRTEVGPGHFATCWLCREERGNG